MPIFWAHEKAGIRGNAVYVGNYLFAKAESRFNASLEM